MLGDQGFQSLEVLQLEFSKIRWDGICPRGTMTSILSSFSFDVVEQRRRHTRPVAPQHASLASSITTLRSLPRSSCRRKCAALAPDIPLPMITTSASVGKDAVVRCPRRILEGSLCQNESVELAVGRLAWPGGAASACILVCWSFPVPARDLFESSMECDFVHDEALFCRGHPL